MVVSNCSSYEDDTVYTNYTCKSYDEQSCDIFCASGSKCYDYCGTDCKYGGGAVCAASLATPRYDLDSPALLDVARGAPPSLVARCYPDAGGAAIERLLRDRPPPPRRLRVRGP